MLAILYPDTSLILMALTPPFFDWWPQCMHVLPHSQPESQSKWYYGSHFI